MGILLMLRNRIVGGVELHPVSGDELFNARQKRTVVYPVVTRLASPAEQAKEQAKADRKKEAVAVEFTSDEMFWMPDERLDDLAAVFERFGWEEKYNISFAGFVKARINNRWNYVPPGMREPETTLEKRYRITGHHEPMGILRLPERRRQPVLPKILVATFVGLVVWVSVMGFQY